MQAENDKGLPALHGLSLTVRAGEIVGLAGVAGNGQSELAQVITGLRQCYKGTGFIEWRRDQQSQSASSASSKAWLMSQKTAPMLAARRT